MIKVDALKPSLRKARMTAAEYQALKQRESEKPVKRKYHNTPEQYAGRTYHSRAEATWARRLDALLMTRQIKAWQPQAPRYDLVLNPETGRMLSYTADFEVILPDGRRLVLDCKGMDTGESRLRRALVHEKYSDSIITRWRDVLAAIEGRATA